MSLTPSAPILVVDDEEPVRRAIRRIVERAGHECVTAGNVDEARLLLHDRPFALILCDVAMPGASGIELLDEVHAHFPDTAVVMVTGVDDAVLAESALNGGAFGYVIKPFEANEIRINIANALRRRELELENRCHRQRLEHLVEERTRRLHAALKELHSSQEETISRLAMAAEQRDSTTGEHLQRMSRYCELVGRRTGFDDERCELLRLASTLHDIGKIGVPDTVLSKPGKLTDEERAVMRRHTLIGERILGDSHAELLQLASVIAVAHHEWVDGTGYPRGLRGPAIPLEARIAAIGDVFDALTSPRPYKAAMSLDEAVSVMRSERGTHFDGDLLDLFLSGVDEVTAIRSAAGRSGDPLGIAAG